MVINWDKSLPCNIESRKWFLNHVKRRHQGRAVFQSLVFHYLNNTPCGTMHSVLVWVSQYPKNAEKASTKPSLLGYRQRLSVLCWETAVCSGESCWAATAMVPLSDAPVENPAPHLRQAPPAFPDMALCLEKCYCPNDTWPRRDVFPFSSDIFPPPLQV